MASLSELIERFKRGPSDLVGIDLGETDIAAVHMRNNNGEFSVVSAGLLPPIEFPDKSASASSSESESPEEAVIPPLVLPPKLKARYASIAIPGDEAIIKLLSLPGAVDDAVGAKVVENLGLDNPDEYRISYKVIVEGHAKSESRVLSTALADSEASDAVKILPTGLPAPFSLEVSGLATMTAFLHGPATEFPDDGIGVMDFGANTGSFGIFVKSTLALIRRFNVGTNAVLNKVQETLGVDRETAYGIMSDGSFDISQPVGEVMESLTKQLIVSRDFVERRENCTVAKLYVSGGLVVSRDSLDEMRRSLGLEVELWNPFHSLTIMPGAIPDELAGREWRFSAAVGACLGTFEEA